MSAPKRRATASAPARATAPAPLPSRRLARASSQRKLDDLLTEAAALIARKGFEATSMRDLGKAMDGSLAGLYHYFSSKDDLLFQLQSRTFTQLLDQQREVAAQPGTPQQRLARMITGHLRFYEQHTNELKACTFEIDSLTGEPYRAVEAIRRRYYALMTSVVAAASGVVTSNAAHARRSRHATLFMFGMLNWIFMWYDPSRHGTVEQIGQEMLDLVSNGLRRTKRSG